MMMDHCAGRFAVWTLQRYAKPKLRALRILVVDDLLIAAEALGAALSADGFDTHLAFSAIEAVEAIDSVVPDVVLLDLNMPYHDGFQAAKIIRSLTLQCQPALIAFSALRLNEVGGRAQGAGFDAYCEKAVPLVLLTQLMQTLFDDAHACSHR